VNGLRNFFRWTGVLGGVGYAHLKDITGSHGDELAGKRIALCVTASASIYRAPETARLLMRHGADVIPVMTREAASLLSPEVMRWATGNDPVVEVTGRIEYVELTEGRGRVDAVVVAPMTENAAAKVVGGIADDAVSLLVSCALGSGIPVVVAPAMHASMYSSPVVRDLMARLRSLGIVVVGPTVEEGKAKLAQPEDVLDAVIYATWPKPLSGRRYLVTAGPTRERIDMVRFVTNPSSGRMGLELARVLRALGGEVTIVHGPVSLRPPWDVKAVGVESAREMLAAVLGALEGADGLFAAAAVADYEPSEVHSGKIESRRHPALQLTLRATPKVVEEVRRSFPGIDLVLFKASYGAVEDPREVFQEYAALDPVLVAVNDVSRKGIGFGAEENELVVVTRSGLVRKLGPARKSRVARDLVQLYLEEKRRGR
jgi:phosphopantothenoylcysteine decarboxylase/phosphopantothenate--cysteine ligase